MNNLQSYKFHQDLINLVNSSGIDVATAYFIIKDVLREVEGEYNKVINLELSEGSNEYTETMTIPVQEDQ